MCLLMVSRGLGRPDNDWKIRPGDAGEYPMSFDWEQPQLMLCRSSTLCLKARCNAKEANAAKSEERSATWSREEAK